MNAIAFLTFLFKIVFAYQHWGALHPALMPWLYAAVSIPFTFVVAVVLVVRPGVLSNYTLWKREKDAWDDQFNKRVYGPWKKITGPFRWLKAGGLEVRWGIFGICPTFYQRTVELVTWFGTFKKPVFHSKQIYGNNETHLHKSAPSKWDDPDWEKDEVQYFLSYRLWASDWSAIGFNWTRLMRILWALAWAMVAIFVVLAIVFYALPWGAKFFVHRPTATPAPTSAPRPTATPAPEVEVDDGGDSIVINLDQQVGDALLEWLNDHAKGVSIPTLSGPLADWLNSLPWPEVAAFEMPEGMDGYVVVARKGDGFELVRLDENGKLIGGPVALKDTKEFTLHARELQWGVRYSDKFRVTNDGQGHIDVYVAESGEPTMATGYHIYNFHLWHIAVLIIVIIAGVVVYRRLTY